MKKKINDQIYNPSADQSLYFLVHNYSNVIREAGWINELLQLITTSFYWAEWFIWHNTFPDATRDLNPEVPHGGRQTHH